MPFLKSESTGSRHDQSPSSPSTAEQAPHGAAGQLVARDRFPEEGFVRLPDILKVLPVSRATFLKGCKPGGRFPPGELLSARVRAWKAKTIRALWEDEPSDPRSPNHLRAVPKRRT